MKILAFEFSSSRRSVAVVESGAELAPRLLGSASETGQRSVKALALVECVLREANLEREQIECIAVGLGPGSYTGVRAAISLAQGWQLARGVKLIGVSSADCLADQAWANGWFGRVTAVIDAQRNEVYLAGYEIGEAGWRETEPLRLATLEEAHLRRQASHLLVGPEVGRWFEEGRLLFPDAGSAGRLAAGRSDFIQGEELKPIYLRETSFVKAPPPRILPG